MLFDLQSNAKKLQRIKLIVYPTVTFLLCLFQISFVSFIEIGGVSPNLLIILVVWIALTEGQFTALFSAFAIGIIYDIFKLDVIGTNALSLVFTAFVTGFFYREGKSEMIVRSLKFFLIVFIGALSHNLIYYILYLKISEIVFVDFFMKYGVASSLYTTVFSFFPILLSFKRRSVNF